MNLQTEPVRLIVLIAALFATIGPALVAIGEGVHPLVAIGAAVTGFGALLGGEEFARSKAYSPARYDADVAKRDRMLDQIASAEASLAGLTLDDLGDLAAGIRAVVADTPEDDQLEDEQDPGGSL